MRCPELISGCILTRPGYGSDINTARPVRRGGLCRSQHFVGARQEKVTTVG
jgi:hypothetical protein